MNQKFISQIDLENEIIEDIKKVKSISSIVNKFTHKITSIQDKTVKEKFWYSYFEFSNKTIGLLVLMNLYRKKFGDREYEKKFGDLINELIIGKDKFDEKFANYLIKEPVYIIKK